MKKCPMCKKSKPTTEFHKNRSTKDGFRSQCKECIIPYQAAYAKSDKGVAVDKKYASSDKGKATQSRADAKRAVTHHGELMARRAVAVALYNGDLIRPDKCESCWSPDNIEAHHADYDQPLMVEWLCRSCHVRLHKSTKKDAA